MSTHGKWDIKVDGVRSVVTKTSEVAEHLEGEAKSYGKHLEGAAKAAGTLSQGGKAPATGLVGLALSQFAEATQNSLKYMGQRTGKSLQGAVDAAKAYLHADYDMAANAQAKAVKDSGPAKYALPKQGKK